MRPDGDRCQDQLRAGMQRIRALRIESVYSLPAGLHAGAVNGDLGVWGGWGWDGAATDTWLGGFFASRQGGSKPGKLGPAKASEGQLGGVVEYGRQAGAGSLLWVTHSTLAEA